MSIGKTGIQEHERFLNSIKSYKPVFTKWAKRENDAEHQFQEPR